VQSYSCQNPLMYCNELWFQAISPRGIENADPQKLFDAERAP